MKNLSLYFMMALLGGSLIFTSCEEDEPGTGGDGNGDGGDTTTTTSNVVMISDDDLQAATYDWSADSVYLLQGLVYLEEGGVLNIPAGTTVRFAANPGTDNTSALIIAKGAQIFAEGTAAEPIVFTAEADTTGNSLTPTSTGLWGGIIILGNAPASQEGTTENISIEGVSSSETRAVYGGNDPADDSGVLTYVSIRYTGVGISAGDEIQGLTLGGVGSGTTIDYVDVYVSADDGVEIFGGTVNLSHFSVAFATDDSYDFDLGWRGNAQYIFALQLEGGEQVYDKVGEWDGADPDDSQLFSAPNIFNATLIGPGQSSTGAQFGLQMRDAFTGKIGNSILEDFPGIGVEVEDVAGTTTDSYDRLTNPVDGYQVEILNNTWAQFGGATDLASLVQPTIEDAVTGETANVVAELTDNANTYSAAAVVTSISRAMDGGLDPRPATADTDVAEVPSGMEQANFRGAFAPGEATWLSGWSTLSQLGFLVD